MSASYTRLFLPILLAIVIITGSFALAAAQSEPVEVEFLRGDLASPIGQAYIEMAELFMKKHPDIKITFTATSGSHKDALVTRILAGTPPDISSLTGTFIAELAEQDMLRDIYFYAENDGVDLSSFILPMTLDYTTWRGALVATPVMVQPFVTYYNVDLFKEAGVEDPNDQAAAGVWNWDTMVESARRITQDTTGDGIPDRWGAAIDASNVNRVNVFVNAAGGRFIHPDRPPFRSALDEPEVLIAFEFLDKLINEWQVIPPPRGRTPDTQFQTGNSAMAFDGPWQIGTNRTAAMQYEWNVAPIPHGPDNDGSVVHFAGPVLPVGSKNPEAAWKFLHFVLTDQEAAMLYMRMTGRPHANLDYLPDYFWIQQEIGDVRNIEVFGKMLLHPRSVHMTPSWPDETSLASSMTTNIRAAFRRETSMANALQTIHEEWNTIFNRFND